MSAVSFLSPLLLYGLAFALVPIVIHLLFRQRYRRVEWGPMRYLKLSLKRTRRRIRLEQFLLLAVRVLAAALLFLIVARPIMRPRGLGALLAAAGRTSRVILLDDSLSMGYRDQGRSAFEQAKELAAQVLDDAGPQDRLTLVLTSNPRAPVLREVELINPAEVRQLIAKLPVSETASAWTPAFEAMEELVVSGTYPIREITLLTDLRRAGWDDKVTAIGDRLAGQQVRLRIIDVGSERIDNLALLSFEQTDRVSLAGVPTRFEAVIQNTGGSAAQGQDATFTVDGKPGTTRLTDIAPAATVRLPLFATFPKPGLNPVSLALPGDDLRGDDRRWLVASARERMRMVLVDGEPSSEPFGGEVDFLALALSLGGEHADAWHVEIQTDAEWSSGALAADPPDLLVLANVAQLTDEQGERLRRLVEAGMGLMIFPGDQVDPDNYNRVLLRDGPGEPGASAAGGALLPAKLEAAVENDSAGLVLEEVSPSPLESLSQLNPAALKRIRIRKSLQISLGAGPNVRMLARWNNPDGSPAAVERAVGRGRVLLWTVSADKAWSDWPTEPSYVMAMREAAKGIARAETITRSVVAGEPYRKTLPVGQEAISPTVEIPERQSPLPVAQTRAGAADKGDATAPGELTVRDTARAGLYKLAWTDARGNAQSDQFAANPDRRESDLSRIPAEEVRRLLSGLAPQVVSASGGASAPGALRGQEIWRTLALVLLGVFVVESCLATWVGRQR